MAKHTKVQKAYHDVVFHWPEEKQFHLLPILRDLVAADETDELAVEFAIAGRIEEWIAEHRSRLCDEEEPMVREIYASNLFKAYQALSGYPAEHIIAMIEDTMEYLTYREETIKGLVAVEQGIRRIYANLDDRTKYIAIMLCRLFCAESTDSRLVYARDIYNQLDRDAAFLASAGKRFANDPQIADLVRAEPLVRVILNED